MDDANTQKEYQDYLEYQHYQQASAQAQNPQQIPDSADRAAQGMKPNAAPISQEPPTLYDRFGNYVTNGISSVLGKDTTDFLRPIADIATATAGGIGEGAALGNIKSQPQYQAPMEEHPTAAGVGKIIGGGVVGAATGSALSKLLAPLMPMGSGLGLSTLRSIVRGSGNVATSGVLAGVAAPGEGESRVNNAISGVESPWTLVPTVLSEGASLAAPFVRSLSNSSMLRAVGLTGAKSKNIPSDLGNRLVEEGIWGTKSGMAHQVSTKYGQVENEIQNLAKDLEGGVSGNTIAKAVKAKASRFIDPKTGRPFSGGQEGHSAITDIADNIESRAPGYIPEGSTPPVQTPTEFTNNAGNPITNSSPGIRIPEQQGSYDGKGLLSLKRLGDENAFNQSGLMGNSYKAEAYRAQADAARNSLAELSDGAMPETLKREQTFLLANKGLMQPAGVSKNPVGLTDIGSALVGASANGLPGAGTAVLASKAAMSPLIQSLFAKGAQSASGSMSEAPNKLPTLFGMMNSAGANGK